MMTVLYVEMHIWTWARVAWLMSSAMLQLMMTLLQFDWLRAYA